MQKHSRLLVEELVQYPGLELTILHPHREKMFPGQRIREIFIDPIDTRKNYLLECYRYSQRIASQLQQLEYDVIYSQGLSVWAQVDQFKGRLIINPHGLEPYQAIGFKNRLLAIPFRMVFSYLFRKAACVISLGGRLTNILQKQVGNAEKITVVPNGVNLSDGTTKPRPADNKVRVLFLARFAANKGINILFNAIEILEQQGLAHFYEFVLAGKGPLYEYYRGKNKFSNVTLTGFVTDDQINSLYREADVFVLPTLFEGMPTVVLEAMTHSLPVIVTDVGATAELVDQQNGFLIKKGSVQALVHALQQFRELGPAERAAMGKASFEKVLQRFTWRSVAEQHLQLFQHLTRTTSGNRQQPVISKT
jgi:glycosyltransferase involved in cell wall biosynthesis